MPRKNNSAYRDFQMVWDPAKMEGRSAEACCRCRSRRAKCNGKAPCRRCRRSGAECIYLSPKEVARREDSIIMAEGIVDDLEELEQMMDRMNGEIGETKRQIAVSSDILNKDQSVSYSEAGEGDQQIHFNSDVAAYNSGTNCEMWTIKLAKDGMQIQTDISSSLQLYEFLARTVRPTTIHRAPTTIPQPVGTRAMMIKSPLPRQYPIYEKTLLFGFYKHVPIPIHQGSSFPVTVDFEEHLLNLILLHINDCPPLARKFLNEGMTTPKDSKTFNTKL
ncbi:hypothetical protein BC936DRAFT_146047 [Jimgerdemannia flammicorona]|uniref:Zn(2)-C6 fungal-type domain-containing protein n=1 Tax=Jimgerdemannia flammicorona TaxID=994334 RepID=A0A433DLK3_9FUNG|nr:hypothetical protein BC936DRAFT_146047 [Jimgerdemannia flammicorona]